MVQNPTFLGNLAALLIVAIALLNFFWSRYIALKNEQNDIDRRVTRLEERTKCKKPPEQ